MSAKATPKTLLTFYDLKNHYRTGSSAELLAVLGRSLDEGGHDDAPPPDSTVRFLSAAAQNDPEIAAGIRALRDRAGSPVLDAVLRELGRPRPRGPALTAMDLDVRWSEFFATGDPAPVREIVAVVAWKDWLRGHVEALLGERRWTDLLFGAKRHAELAERLRPLGVRVDLERRAVENACDLDGLILDAKLEVDAAKVKALQAALPRPLTAPELLVIATKTSAIWSLASNGASHPRVVDACVEALADADDRVRRSLSTILANARVARGEFAEALALAEEALAAEPEDGNARDVARRAREGIYLETAAALLDDMSDAGVAAADTTALRERAQGNAPEAYRALVEMRSPDRPTHPRIEGVSGEYTLLFRGDRVLGEWWFWDGPSAQALADQWITLPDAHYENPGLWVRTVDRVRDPAHRALRREPYVALLARAPDATLRRTIAEGAYLGLRYAGRRLPELSLVVGLPDVDLAVTLWLREADGALVASSVARSTGDGSEAPAWVRTVFVYGELPEIEEPTAVIDMRDGPTAPVYAGGDN